MTTEPKTFDEAIEATNGVLSFLAREDGAARCVHPEYCRAVREALRTNRSQTIKGRAVPKDPAAFCYACAAHHKASALLADLYTLRRWAQIDEAEKARKPKDDA